MQAAGAVPAVVALTDRDLAAYHGVEHKAIAAYEQGIDDPATVPKEHDRCGSNLIAPMMLLSTGGTVLLERLVEKPGPLARAAVGWAAPRSRWRCSPGAIGTTAAPSPRPSTRPAGRSSAGLPPGSRRRSSSRSGSRRWPRSCGSRQILKLPPFLCRVIYGKGTAEPGQRRLRAVFGRIDHIGVAVEDIDAAIALYEGSSGCRSCTARRSSRAGRRGGAARRRRRARRAAGAARPGDRGGQVPRAQGPRPAPRRLRGRATSTRPCGGSADAGIELIDAEPRVGIRDSRVAFVHPRSTGGVLIEIVEPAEGH